VQHARPAIDFAALRDGAEDDGNLAVTALVPIAGSWFTMGSTDGNDNERPVHRVWVDAFELGACQVTNAEYARFAPPPCRDDAALNDPDQPVVAVS